MTRAVATALQQRPGDLVSPGGSVGEPESAEAPQYVRVLRTVDAFSNIEGAPGQADRFVVIAAQPVDVRQTLERPRDQHVVGTEAGLLNREGAFKQRLSFIQVAEARVQHTERGEAGRRGGMLCSEGFASTLQDPLE